MKLFALTTRGLESIGAAELEQRADVTISAIAYRRIALQATGDPGALLDLRTIDDLFVDIGCWTDIGRPRSTLETVRRRATQLDLSAALRLCATVRTIPARPSFSVTASFVGKRNYSSDEIKAALAEGIAASYGWPYHADDRLADLNIRIFIEHEQAFVGVRLSGQPLHERRYKQVHRPGSLKPTVAAALALLAGAQPGMLLVDPCCGAGTIPIEAALAGALAQGGDHDPEAVVAAQRNVQAAGLDLPIQRWDVRDLPLGSASVASVATNLPWGRQIAVDAALVTFYRQALHEIARVLVPGGRLAILTSLPELLQTSLRPTRTLPISLFGQTPTIAVFTKS